MSPSKTLPQVFIITPQEEGNYSSQTAFSEDAFFPSGKGEGEYHLVEKVTKIQPTRVLVTSFDKFQHDCNFYIFDFCFFVL